MKKILLFLIVVLWSGCITNDAVAPTPSPEALQKANEFQSGVKEGKERSPFQYTILETLDPTYNAAFLGESTKIIFSYAKTDLAKGSSEFEKLISSIPSDNGQMNSQSRADLQFLTYVNLEHFLLKEDNKEAIANNLRRLMNYAAPLETRVLSKALTQGSSFLTAKEIETYSEHISELNTKGYSHMKQLAEDDRSRLEKESQEAVSLINKLYNN